MIINNLKVIRQENLPKIFSSNILNTHKIYKNMSFIIYFMKYITLFES